MYRFWLLRISKLTNLFPIFYTVILRFVHKVFAYSFWRCFPLVPRSSKHQATAIIQTSSMAREKIVFSNSLSFPSSTECPENSLHLRNEYVFQNKFMVWDDCYSHLHQPRLHLLHLYSTIKLSDSMSFPFSCKSSHTCFQIASTKTYFWNSMFFLYLYVLLLQRQSRVSFCNLFQKLLNYPESRWQYPRARLIEPTANRLCILHESNKFYTRFISVVHNRIKELSPHYVLPLNWSTYSSKVLLFVC